MEGLTEGDEAEARTETARLLEDEDAVIWITRTGRRRHGATNATASVILHAIARPREPKEGQIP